MKTIRGKIMATVLAVSVCSLALLSVVSVVSMSALRDNVVALGGELGTTAGEDSRKALETQILGQLTQVAQSKATYADEKLGKQQTYVRMVAAYLRQLYENPAVHARRAARGPDPALDGQLSAQLLYFGPETDAAALAGEVGLTANTADLLMTIAENDPEVEAAYFASKNGFSLTVDSISGSKPDFLDCPTRQWWKTAMEAGDLAWTDVFDDAMGRGLAITCAMPYRDGAGEIGGVVAFGSLISTLNDEIIHTRIGETGYAFVVNDQGQTIISPNIQKDENGFIIRESLLDEADSELVSLAKEMLDGGSGVSRVTFRGREVYMAYQPMTVRPWTVVTVMDVDEAMAPAYATRDGILATADATVSDIDGAIRGVLIAIAVVVAAAIVVVVGASALLAGRLTRPLHSLTEGVGRIGGGDLDYKLDLHTGDEIENLAGAFNAMTGSLQTYIRDLTAVTAEKERIGAELSVATEIQASMLPCIFPAFPDRPEFDIFADMHPAKEVGGDFYDFFMTDPDHLWVVMADVSGKGVPAALFMVIAKTLLKNHAGFLASPGEVLTVVNDQLCETNEAGMFVTTFMGRLELSTGAFTFANAGHNFPLLYRKGADYEWLKTKPNFVLAGMEGVRFQDHTVDLAPGDRLFLYTDGVTEALNPAQELYSDPRLLDTLNRPEAKALSLEGLVAYMKADIAAFADGAAQADDITMLALELRQRPQGEERRETL